MNWKIIFVCVKKQKNADHSLVPLVPTEESGKQNTWFAAKMLIENGFIGDVKQWLRNNESVVDVVDDVHPDDSMSNVASKRSHRKGTWSATPQTNLPVCHKDSRAWNTHTVETRQQCILGSGQETHRKTTETYGTTQYGDTQHLTLYLPVNNEQSASVEQPHPHSVQMHGDLCTINHVTDHNHDKIAI